MSGNNIISIQQPNRGALYAQLISNLIDEQQQRQAAKVKAQQDAQQKILSAPPEVRPALAKMLGVDYDATQYPLTAEQQYKADFLARANQQLPNLPTSAVQQAGYRIGTGADMPSDTVKMTNANDVYSNPQAFAPQMQTRQGVEDKILPTGGEQLTVGEQSRHNQAEESQTGPLRQAQGKEATAKAAEAQAGIPLKQAQTAEAQAKADTEKKKNSLFTTATGAPAPTGDLSKEPTIVQMLVRRDYDPMLMRRLPLDQQESLLQRASLYDPTISTGDYATQYATKKSFSSGPDAAANASINRLVGHLNTLNNAYANLNNNRFPFLNSVENYIGENAGSTGTQSALGSFRQAKNFVVNEAAKVAKGIGPSAEQEVAHFRDSVKESTPPAEFQGAVKTLFDLLGTAAATQQQKYKNGVGRDFDVYYPVTKKILTKMGVESSGDAAGPRVGDRKTFPNGAVGQWDGQGWAQVQ